MDAVFNMLESGENEQRPHEGQNRDMIDSPTQGGEQTRYFARILLDHLPSWLGDEIQSGGLSICDWGGTEGEAADSFRSHFPQSRAIGIGRTAGKETPSLPATFDVVAASNVLQFYEAPWAVLEGLGAHAERHLLVLVPFREVNRPREHAYTFDDASIATRITPDFVLSSSKVIDDGRQGWYILLVYSRLRYVPHSGAAFDQGADHAVAGVQATAGRNEALAQELGRAAALLETRDAELRKMRQRESALRRDIQQWQAQAAALGKQLEQQAGTAGELRAGRQYLQSEVTRLAALEKKYAADHHLLTKSANQSAYEAAGLRRTLTELQSSLSWKITAPLRYLTKPLFQSLSRKAEQGAAREAGKAAAEASSAAAPSPIDTIIAPAFRNAQSIAIIQCGVPFSETLNQRPISYAKYLADRGTTVLFVEVWQTPEAKTHLTGEEVYPRIFSIPFYPFQKNIVHTFQDNIDAIAEASRGKCQYLCTLPSTSLNDVIRPLRAVGYHIHYDIMDDWEEFHRGGEAHWYSAGLERELVALSDTVTSVSDKLAEKFDRLRGDVAVVRNGYQPSALCCEQFVAARAPLESPKVVGYFGHFSDAWFDWETVFYAAKKRPDLVFELIGYGLSERSRVRLQDYPNIRFEGLVPQNNLHRYAAKWWAGMIPFRPSAVSVAVDPLKIYEYLHFGLATIVTGISGIAHYPLVSYARDAAGFVEALEQLPDRPDAQSLAKVEEFLKECVWEARLAKLDSIISQPAGLASLYAR